MLHSSSAAAGKPRSASRTKPKNFKAKLKKALPTLFLLAFAALFAVFPDRYVPVCLDGIALWALNVLPAVFPFLFVPALLRASGGAQRVSRVFSPFAKALFGTGGEGGFCFFMSVLSGYPVGASLVSAFKADGVFSDDEAQILACACSTSGPLFVIGSGLDTLAAAPDALPALLPVLQERVGFVRRLTEDLFLAAKLEQKQVLLNEDRARLEALTAAVCSACQAEAAHKGVELRTDTGTPLPVWGDAVRLEQILQNLVTNAIHYTPSGGRVTVVCAAENGQACVKVTDTGCGIAPEDQPAVFDRYFHTTADTKHDSTGLGLTIAQELAHLHRGEIMLQSEPGKGSCFPLCLPLLDAE